MDTHSIDTTSMSSLSTSPCKRIRFFEYASLIPRAGDPDSPSAQPLHQHQQQQQQHHPSSHQQHGNSRPRLCARTYSVPIPTSLTSIFSSPPPPSLANDPSFFPNSPPRLSLKVPSFTRRRRYTVANPENLKSCLKKRRSVQAANASHMTTGTTGKPTPSLDQGNTAGTPATRKGRRANSTASYLDDNNNNTSTAAAPLPSPSFNPIYCPALAKVMMASISSSSSHTAGPASSSGLQSTSPPATSTSALSTSSSSASSMLAAAAAAAASPPPPATLQTPTTPSTSDDLLPVRECCRACFRATAYGERCSDADYHETWSKAALEKRKRDEEILFERGEYAYGGRKAAPHDGHHHGHQDAERSSSPSFPSSPPASTKGEGKHCLNISHVLHHGDRDGREHSKDKHDTIATAVKECKGGVDELDLARQRLCKLDLGGRQSGLAGEHGNGSGIARASPPIESEDGDGLDMEGIDDAISKAADKGADSGADATMGRARARTGSSANSKGRIASPIGEEKNPICQLSGRKLIPCSSRSIYTGVDASAARARSDSNSGSAAGNLDDENIPPGLMLQLGEDQVSNASSSDLSSDELASSLAPFANTPASVATTAASSWLPDDDHDGDFTKLGDREQPFKLDLDLDSPVVEKQNTHDDDRVLAAAAQQQAGAGKPSTRLLPSAPVNAVKEKDYSKSAPVKPACSPLMRSKGCIRPTGLYTDPILEEGNEIVKIKGGFDSDEEEEEDRRTGAPAQKDSKWLPMSTSTAKSAPAVSAADKEAELAEALRQADKPLFPFPHKKEESTTSASSSGTSSGKVSRPAFGRSRSSGVDNDRSSAATEFNSSGSGGRASSSASGGRRERSSSMGWTAKFMHPGRMLSSFGPSHGIVH